MVGAGDPGGLPGVAACWNPSAPTDILAPVCVLMRAGALLSGITWSSAGGSKRGGFS